jgi:hypothetical protein
MTKKLLRGKDKEIFDKLTQQLPGVEFVKFFDRGSTARVYHVRLPVGPDMETRIDRIIKVFRSKMELNQGIDPNLIFQNEVAKLIAITHSNVISVYSAGYLDATEEKLPYYVMEFILGARDLDEWLEERGEMLKRETIIQLLMQAAESVNDFETLTMRI